MAKRMGRTITNLSFTSFQYHNIRLIDLVNGHIAMKVKNVFKSNMNREKSIYFFPECWEIV
ncbi:hypothetical protein [Ureibacillus sp. GCM10028918]|uniref:hypothetical protein n=1 Tax=Ureibacillus sp. GCM10028918 TaxID=3273429 RepID=UPI0036137583